MKLSFDELKKRKNAWEKAEQEGKSPLSEVIADLRKEWRAHRGCPDDETLAGYADRTLLNKDWPRWNEVHAHRQECTLCGRDITEIEEALVQRQINSDTEREFGGSRRFGEGLTPIYQNLIDSVLGFIIIGPIKPPQPSKKTDSPVGAETERLALGALQEEPYWSETEKLGTFTLTFWKTERGTLRVDTQTTDETWRNRLMRFIFKTPNPDADQVAFVVLRESRIHRGFVASIELKKFSGEFEFGIQEAPANPQDLTAEAVLMSLKNAEVEADREAWEAYLQAHADELPIEVKHDRFLSPLIQVRRKDDALSEHT
jgi:hypothetical protein